MGRRSRTGPVPGFATRSMIDVKSDRLVVIPTCAQRRSHITHKLSRGVPDRGGRRRRNRVERIRRVSKVTIKSEDSDQFDVVLVDGFLLFLSAVLRHDLRDGEIFGLFFAKPAPSPARAAGGTSRFLVGGSIVVSKLRAATLSIELKRFAGGGPSAAHAGVFNYT